MLQNKNQYVLDRWWALFRFLKEHFSSMRLYSIDDKPQWRYTYCCDFEVSSNDLVACDIVPLRTQGKGVWSTVGRVGEGGILYETGNLFELILFHFPVAKVLELAQSHFSDSTRSHPQPVSTLKGEAHGFWWNNKAKLFKLIKITMPPSQI
jgi:hypothetical protein